MLEKEEKVYYDDIEKGTADASQDPSRNMFKGKFTVVIASSLAIIVALVGALFMLAQVLDISYIKVNGSSMSPTFDHQDGVFIYTNENNPQSNDIVVFMSPESWIKAGHIQGQPRFFVKRAAGVPGDNITLSRDGVIVNGEEILNNKELGIQCPQKEVNLTLSDNTYLLLGDNHEFSSDSYRLYCSGLKIESVLVNRDLVYTYGDILFHINGGWEWFEKDTSNTDNI